MCRVAQPERPARGGPRNVEPDRAALDRGYEILAAMGEANRLDPELEPPALPVAQGQAGELYLRTGLCDASWPIAIHIPEDRDRADRIT